MNMCDFLKSNGAVDQHDYRPALTLSISITITVCLLFTRTRNKAQALETHVTAKQPLNQKELVGKVL